MLGLMFIGRVRRGSCAGGIKVTTFRVLIAAAVSQFRGRRQSVIGKFAVSEDAIKKAFVLFVFSVGIVFIASFVLDFTEGGDLPHDQVRGQFLEILFETVSAFGTVGLSTGITPTLSAAGKWGIDTADAGGAPGAPGADFSRAGISKRDLLYPCRRKSDDRIKN